MRDEMMGAVMRRAIEHPEFRQRLVDDPRGALSDHGFALEHSDFEQIKALGDQLRGQGGEEADRLLRQAAEKFGAASSGQ